MQSRAPNLPYADVQTFEALLAPQLRPWSVGATLFAAFGALALVIAAAGLYSRNYRTGLMRDALPAE